MLSINDRVYWNGTRATVSQLWKKKVRITTAAVESVIVAIEELTPYIEPIGGQLPLIDVSQFEVKGRAGFFDWEMDCSEVNELGSEPIDPNSIDPNSIDPNSIDPNSLDPNSLDPNSLPHPGNHEIKTIKGNKYLYWRWWDGKVRRSKYLGRAKT